MTVKAEMRAEESPGTRPADWMTAPLVVTVDFHAFGYGGARVLLNQLALDISRSLRGREVRWNYEGMEQGHYLRWGGAVLTNGNSD